MTGGGSQATAFYSQAADAAQKQAVVQVVCALVVHLRQIVQDAGVAGDPLCRRAVEVQGHLPADLEVSWAGKGRVDLVFIIKPVVLGCIGLQGSAGVDVLDGLALDRRVDGNGGGLGKHIVLAVRGDAARINVGQTQVGVSPEDDLSVAALLCIRQVPLGHPRLTAAEQMDVPCGRVSLHILQSKGVPVGHDGGTHVGAEAQSDILEGHIRAQQNAGIPERQAAALDGHGLVDDQGIIVAYRVFQDKRARQLDGVAVLGGGERAVEFVRTARRMGCRSGWHSRDGLYRRKP